MLAVMIAEAISFVPWRRAKLGSGGVGKRYHLDTTGL